MKMLAALLSGALVLSAQDSRRLQMGDGTPVEIRVAQTVSSEDARVDDRVDFLVAEDVRVDGRAVITRGSLAWGVVREAAPKGRLARDGKLAVEILGVCRADGARLLLRAYHDREAAPTMPQTSAAESLMAIPALPILMFVQGKEKQLPRGHELTVHTAEAMQIDSDRLSPEPRRDCISTVGAAAPIAPAKTPEIDLATVAVRSTPSNAEIQVDGRFSGNTPSALRLTPGSHRILISLPGHRVYDRVIEVTPGGDVSVVVTLEERSTGTKLAGN